MAGLLDVEEVAFDLVGDHRQLLHQVVEVGVVADRKEYCEAFLFDVALYLPGVAKFGDVLWGARGVFDGLGPLLVLPDDDVGGSEDDLELIE